MQEQNLEGLEGRDACPSLMENNHGLPCTHLHIQLEFDTGYREMFHPYYGTAGQMEKTHHACASELNILSRGEDSVVVALQQQYKYIEAVVVCLWSYSVAAVAEIASQQLISIIINISPILIG